MQDSKTNKVISKIQKLLSLAASPNKHEAERASVMAFELMAKYDIEMSEITTQDASELVQQELYSTGRVNRLVWHVNAILKKYFLVSVLQTSTKDGQIIKLVGKKHRIEVAKHVFSFLMASADNAWKNHRDNITTSSKKETMARKANFQIGFINGVSDKIAASKKQLQETGLVLVKDQDLDDFLEGKTKSVSVSLAYDHHNDQGSGYNTGMKTNIFNAVGNKSNKGILV